MATAVSENYTAASGATVYAGRQPALLLPTVPMRDAESLLFQAVPYDTIPPRIPNPNGYQRDTAFIGWPYSGANVAWVDAMIQWAWNNTGGDWLDANQTPNPASGVLNWATGDPVPSEAFDGVPDPFTMDVTTLAQYVQTQNRWFAVGMAAVGQRQLTTHLYTNVDKRPYVSVTYTDATSENLPCTFAGWSDGFFNRQHTVQFFTLPDFGIGSGVGRHQSYWEFRRPTKAVSSATLNYFIYRRDVSNNARVYIYGVMNPSTRNPIDQPTVDLGSKDVNAPGHSTTMFCHRYLDGTVKSDFFSSTGYAEFPVNNSLSPHIFTGNSADINTSKLPYIHAGKWLSYTSNNTGVDALVTKINSNYSGEGFAPLAAGLGALRIHRDGIFKVDGDTSGQAQWGLCDFHMLLPEPDIGLLDHIRIRYYQRIHLSSTVEPDQSKFTITANPEMIITGDRHTFSNRAGKGGISADHVCSDGGYSGTSGGGGGFQLRHSWKLHQWQMGGPNEGLKMTPGWHLYDYVSANPPGYNYGNSTDELEFWGQKGGYGGYLRADVWHCIEVEIKLNSVNVSSGTGDGKNWTPNGYLKCWVDGRVVYHRTGMVFRTLPKAVANPIVTNTSVGNVFREIGLKAIRCNWYHGGRGDGVDNYTIFYSGLVVRRGADGYIGPMKGEDMADRFLHSVDGLDADTGADWALAKATIETGIAGIDVAGDRVLINSAHNEVSADIIYAAPGTNASPMQILSVTPTGASGISSLTAGAIFNANGGVQTWSGSFYAYGLTLIGSAAGSTELAFAASNGDVQVWDTCTFKFTVGGASSTFQFGANVTGGGSRAQLLGPVFETAHAGQTIYFKGDVEIRGGSWSAAGTDPSNVFTPGGAGAAARGNRLVCDGFDFTNIPTTSNLVGTGQGGSTAIFRNCKLPAAWTGAPIADASLVGGFRVEMYNCDSADTNYMLWIKEYAGSIKHSTTVYSDVGASDGTTRISWEMATSANVAYPCSTLASPEIVRWNETVGSAITVTVQIVHNSQGTGTAGAVTDKEVWLEVEYLGTLNAPLALFAKDSVSVITTAADQASSVVSWTGDAAGWDTQALSVTFTPQEKGYLIGRVVVGKASSTIYVDPLMTVT